MNKITSADSTVEEKVELYDKLMKKMDGDYTNLLTPAIAKAKAIEEQAEREYALRIDQARYAAEGIYTQAAEKIADVVDVQMDRMYNRLDAFLYSKTLVGRLTSFGKGCKIVAIKVGSAPVKAVKKVKAKKAAKKAAKAEKEAVAAQ